MSHLLLLSGDIEMNPGPECPCGATGRHRKLIECSHCKQKWHTECVGLKELADAADKLKSWCCPLCIQLPDKIKKILISSLTDETMVELKEENSVLKAKVEATKSEEKESIKELQDKILQTMTTTMTEMETRFNEKLDNLSEKVENVQVDKNVNVKGWPQIVSNENDEVVPSFKDIMMEAMNKTKKDEIDQQQRAKNIIIYNVKESKAKKNEDKKKDDETIFDQICDTIDITYLEDSDITKITRIGEKNDENVRPLLVCFSELIHKESFMENLKKLKGTEFKTISVRHDMNRTEREIGRNLAKEADAKNFQRSEGEKESFIFRVRGPPGYQQIKKIKIRGQ